MSATPDAVENAKAISLKAFGLDSVTYSRTDAIRLRDAAEAAESLDAIGNFAALVKIATVNGWSSEDIEARHQAVECLYDLQSAQRAVDEAFAFTFRPRSNFTALGGSEPEATSEQARSPRQRTAFEWIEHIARLDGREQLYAIGEFATRYQPALDRAEAGLNHLVEFLREEATYRSDVYDLMRAGGRTQAILRLKESFKDLRSLSVPGISKKAIQQS